MPEIVEIMEPRNNAIPAATQAMQADLMSPLQAAIPSFDFLGGSDACLTLPCQRPSRPGRPPLTKRLSGSLDSIMTSIKMELRMDVTALSVRQHSFNNLAAETMPDTQSEPAVALPESPKNGVFSPGGKGSQISKFTITADPLSSSQVTSANNSSTRFAAKRSQLMSRQLSSSTSTSSSSAEQRQASHDSSERVTASSSQSELQNFNHRKVSQTQIGGSSNGLSSSAVTCVTASTASTSSRAVSSALSSQSTLTSTAGVREVQAGAARAALQSQASAASFASAANARQLAKSFDSLKSMSMDKLKDSLSMEKLDDRDLLNIDLGSEGGSRDPNVQVFEQKQSYSTSNKKLVTNDFSAEEATANSEQMTHLQEGDTSYRENKASSDMRAKLEMNGITAEKGLSTRQVSTAIAI
ncbi:Sterile alpha and TIR motif-containing protein 1 [Amphibalanus amphitrite]|uniref:Sterile alpha and TIR motif-containing protein 1 n=1 Tax=Amphibalanus amphitrite TaxID=1232801 RepID=A0A6A4WUN5_AMPAM|nr:Sterile alpha and TIR motif-containing protein 1 [Amphibalanus amphitrite]